LLQPRIDAMCRVLLQGEADRGALREPRWQAGYDLALGRALAVQVRTAGYNAMLAAAKQGLAFREERNNTWVLRAADQYAASSLERTARQAEEALQRVLDQHPQTPWALLAQQELAVPLGWEWTEDYTQLEPLVEGGNAPPRPRPEPMMEQGPPRRNPPPL
jgi:hypothetical protein